MTSDNLKLLEQTHRTWQRLKALDIKFELQERSDWNYGDLAEFVDCYEDYKDSRADVLKAVAEFLFELSICEESFAYMYEDAIYELKKEHGLHKSFSVEAQQITDALEIVAEHYDNI